MRLSASRRDCSSPHCNVRIQIHIRIPLLYSHTILTIDNHSVGTRWDCAVSHRGPSCAVGGATASASARDNDDNGTMPSARHRSTSANVGTPTAARKPPLPPPPPPPRSSSFTYNPVHMRITSPPSSGQCALLSIRSRGNSSPTAATKTSARSMPVVLGCLLLSNSNLLLGVQYTVTVITYCNYCGYCHFLKSSITVCPFEVV